MITTIILAFLVYKYLFTQKNDDAYFFAVREQANPFKSSKESNVIIWTRAKSYLTENKSLLGGGQLQDNDSLLYLPYYNDYKKGTSIRIERHFLGDSVLFFVQYWYSQKLSEKGAKEIALYMQKNTTKYK